MPWIPTGRVRKILKDSNVNILNLSAGFQWKSIISRRRGPRALKSTTRATIVGGPKEFGETKGCNCIFKGGPKVYYCTFEDLD